MSMPKKVRVTVILQPSGKSTVLIVNNENIDDLLKQCSSKLKVKARRLFISTTGIELTSFNASTLLSDDLKIIVTSGNQYTINNSSATDGATSIDHVPETEQLNSHPAIVRIIARDTLIDQSAIDQLNNVAKLYRGVKYVIGMPDLHAGQSTPIGSVVASEEFIYPELIGTDIGCGMSFIRTNLKSCRLTDKKLLKWVKQLNGLDDNLGEDVINQYLKQDLQWPMGINVERVENDISDEYDIYNQQLGTIGGGNHFAELQEIEQVLDKEAFSKLGLDMDCLYLLVHSGSRSLGEAILRKYSSGSSVKGLRVETDEYRRYMKLHDTACAWAKRNRSLIAKRFLSYLGCSTEDDEDETVDNAEYQCIVDIWHNNVVLKRFNEDGGENLYLHRKGACPSDQGCVVIPGSRGTRSYLVQPIVEKQEYSGYSLAHGAGRVWSRTKARQQLSERYPNAKQLQRTDLNSHVICDDKNLLYEEAPQCYKDIDVIIQDLVDFELVKVIAIMKPLITYKMREK
ncbi:unnamed protein product [Didymodactylos carnosus]|uniref:3'-phosphate/5'-hydroxy nucleic acid ligase n=1 Tax=Didymodactylos carnosus TaxID=1234261 RepID=A0A814IB26_9BILA|nr:unnamed protein product [Didymodactylos carnosus]CAF1021562.1 unnamed protein product [Didymodactylos carnosus]CAF3695603.1 unnamed protein product [Didymodactylos carnosus]CAF3792972.1 unnamed protein product [Didymodactylos carnosus]